MHIRPRPEWCGGTLYCCRVFAIQYLYIRTNTCLQTTSTACSKTCWHVQNVVIVHESKLLRSVCSAWGVYYFAMCRRFCVKRAAAGIVSTPLAVVEFDAVLGVDKGICMVGRVRFWWGNDWCRCAAGSFAYYNSGVIIIGSFCGENDTRRQIGFRVFIHCTSVLFYYLVVALFYILSDM